MDAKLKLYLSLAVFASGAMLPVVVTPSPNLNPLLAGYCLWAAFWALPPFCTAVWRWTWKLAAGCSLFLPIGCLAQLVTVWIVAWLGLAYALLGGGILHFVLHLRRMG